MELALAAVGAAVLVFWPLVVCGALLLRLAGRYRRRGGASRPAALRLTSPTATYTTKLTQRSAGFTSSPGALGFQSEGAVIPLELRQQNSPFARGSSGTAAGAGRSPGQRQGLAG